MKYLIIAVLIVGGYAIFDYYNEEKIEQKKIEAATIVPFKKDQISEVTFVKAEKTLKLTKDKDSWKLLSPVVDDANPEDVEGFLEELMNEKNIQILAEDRAKDLAVFGLDKPFGSIQLKTNSGETKTWLVGTKKNFQGEWYVKEEGSKSVFTASNMWQNIVDKKPIEFREKRWFRNSLAGVETIQIKNTLAGEVFGFKKDGPNWVFADSVNKVDQNRVREFLSKLNSNKVDEYVAEGKPDATQIGKWGFNKILFKVTLNFKEANPWVAEFSESNKVALLKTNEPAFVLKVNNQDWVDLKARTKDSFRDRSEMFRFDSNAITRVDFDSPVKKAHLNKDNTKWVLLDDVKQIVNQEKVSQLISELSKLEVKEFLKDKPKNFNPQQKITLKNSKKEVVLEMALWDETVKVSTYPQYFTLDKSAIDKLQWEQVFSEAPKASIPKK